LISSNAIAFANVVYKFATGLLFMPVLFHPDGKGILPVKEHAVSVN
jgi:hypothetical protein